MGLLIMEAIAMDSLPFYQILFPIEASRSFEGTHGEEMGLRYGATTVHKRRTIQSDFFQPFEQVGSWSKMLSVGCLAVSLALAGSVLAGPVQNPSIVLPPSARAHRDAVQQIFTESYSAYKLVHSSSSLFFTYAFPSF